MSNRKTRMNSTQRRSIVLAHTSNIRPSAGAVPETNTLLGVAELRKKGSRVLSQLNAVLARRASFHVG